ncbi:hypothetical protein [Curvibacter sp. PAE-UM]|uniref:hypothetical protein n=1 Tax=Curvibacter sp. PAE-UM TaxID=1714344 RepID=UPI00070C041D|nr:hypothetical protein [Curvibacter sp. PAE-UM]KRH99470.1 hypothetical protein AO057_02785 [Curvibacter sp. PAE-UM]
MSATATRPPQPDRSTIVARHQSYRGLKIEQNLLSQFTMYVVELDQFGLFISDSRPEAFDMAFEALFSASPQARTA